MSRPKILVLASGTAEGGGSGFENLVKASRGGVLEAEIVAVVSNYQSGGVRMRANKLGIPFIHFPAPWDATSYQNLAQESGAEFFASSGWLKLITGLDPNTNFNSQTVFNIHPAPLPQFGGRGFFGQHVHERVLAAFRERQISHSAVCMHFVTGEYDLGPIFFHCPVEIKEDDTPSTLQARVNRIEHIYQPAVTNMVVNGSIKWDGVNPQSLALPRDYSISREIC